MRLLGVSGLAAVIIVAGFPAPSVERARFDVRALKSQTAVLTPTGVVAVRAGDTVQRFAGTNVLLTQEGGAEHAASAALADEQRRWLASGDVPGPEDHKDMARQALLDLDTMLLEDGALLAAPNGAWRYTWPRDASFAAVALSRTGHTDDAARILLHLADLQSADGTFQARYATDGSGLPPDDRGVQLDGDGWFLWAAAEWLEQAPEDGRASVLSRLRPALTRAVDAIEASIDPMTGSPKPSPDYWEVPETGVTLGSISALLLGARSVQELAGAAPRGAQAQWTGELAARGAALEALLEGAVHRDFAAHGYPRHAGGALLDASVAFLMPPFAPADAEVRAAWERAAVVMSRPAGGLAPGEGWHSDGISWTPQTALFALAAAASGDDVQATGWLAWLDAHRTAAGSLPEKVLWNGQPAEVAPLSWTSALVLLALVELDERQVGALAARG
ncbi:glycoside hydrolase family 15 [Cellulomonas cellasea]|uniref:glycoside hydrolase family 15 n=1 Tax=Cellulomonas cellasea TaxID=43670 RepID=UPI0025A41DB6|nr:glycoside hydrolase family 15 [Cellulomonas cellasea]MDM8083173.1 glycoside hydrolase family 15 [Cellulomonas cellasea]